jgi:D-alanyl-D-alanine carboxypeptidase
LQRRLEAAAGDDPDLSMSVDALLLEFGIARALLRRRGLQRHREARSLTPVGLGTDGRDKLLTPAAARAWLSMRDAAARDGVTLLLVSAFRSAELSGRRCCARDWRRARAIESGACRSTRRRATANITPAARSTSARRVAAGSTRRSKIPRLMRGWSAKPASYGFTLSYPRDNAQGYLYEPWHWCFS